ncbi:MAG: hypothetical protein QG632_244, partial [Candidatus Dependentiae bacterium]|nr:hypothetical protein [Candidatus Dependentiae bacterium]
TTKEQDQGNAAEFRPVGLAQLIKNASPDEVPTTLDRAEELLALASLAHVDADREERLRVANEKLHAISAMLQVKLSNAYNSYRASGSTTEIRRLLRQNQKRLKDNEDALAAYNNKSVISNAPLDVAAFRAALKEKAKTLAALVERRTAERDALLFKHNMSLAKSSIENDTISWVKALERAEAEYAKRSASDPEREMLEQAIESIKANLGELDSPERAADYVAREAKLKRRAIKEVHEKEEATARAAGVVGTRKTVVKQIDLHTKKLQEVKVALAALPTETAGSTSSMLSSNTSDLSMRHELKRIMNDLTEKLDSLTRDLEFLTEEDGKRRVQPSDYEHAVTLLSEAEDSLREFNTAHPGRHVDLSKDEKDRLAVLTHDVKNRKKQADAINSAKNAFSLNSSFSKYDLKKLRDLEAQLVIATAANDTEQIAALNVEIDATRAELARRRDMMILKEIKSAKDIEGLKEIFEEELARNSGEDERVSAPVINPNYNKKHLKARKDFMSHQHLMKKEHFMTKRISKKAIIARIKELNDALKEPDR